MILLSNCRYIGLYYNFIKNLAACKLPGKQHNNCSQINYSNDSWNIQSCQVVVVQISKYNKGEISFSIIICHDNRIKNEKAVFKFRGQWKWFQFCEDTSKISGITFYLCIVHIYYFVIYFDWRNSDLKVAISSQLIFSYSCL